MNFFNLSLQLNGFAIHKAIKKLQALEKNASDSLETRQNIFTYHLANNPFYHHLIGQNKFTHWEDIPILTKDMLHVPLEERLSNEYKNKKILTANTSGSSGYPFHYAKDKFCHALTWAHVLKLYKSISVDYGQSLQARFYGIPKKGLKHTIELYKDKLSKRKRFVVFDVTDDKLEKFIIRFKKHKFYYIYGYASAIVLFAKYLQTKNIQLKDICPTIKLCITTSEILLPEDRILLQKQFEIPVFNEYGASEVGIIAFENKENRFILNDKTIYTEIVDDEGNTLPYGQTGRIIVTALYNKAHPFIRYEVGDLGAIEIDKQSGHKVLSRLVGRTNEYAILEDGRRIAAFTFYYLIKSVSQKIDVVRELKIIQIRKDWFRVEYTAARKLYNFEEILIQNAFEEYLETRVRLTLQLKPFLERSKSGKLKQFESQL